MCFLKQCQIIEIDAFCRRASAAVNYLKCFHEKKKRGAKPYSLYLDHILRTSGTSHYCRDQHFRPQRDIFIVKVHTWPHIDHIFLQRVFSDFRALCFLLKVKLSPKSEKCDWIWVKPNCKCIITTKEALLRFTIVLFSDKLIFNGEQGHSDASSKIAIFKTLRMLDTTVLVVSPGSLHMNTSIENIVCVHRV